MWRRGLGCSLTGAVLSLFHPAPASAQNVAAPPPASAPLPPALRLDYAAAEHCPDASFFRDRVVLKRPSHRDPFVASARPRLVVTSTRDPSGYRGRWIAYDAADTIVRTHELGPVSNCHDLVDGLAFGFVMRFDDPGAPATSAPTPAPAPAPPPPLLSPPPAQETPNPAPDPPRPGRVALGVSALLGLATTPAPAGGGVLAIGWRAPWWSISAELRALLSLNAPIDSKHDVSLHRVTGAAVPCLHWRWLFGCGALELGELGGSSNADLPVSDSAFIVTAGGRAGVEIPISTHLAFRAAVDGFGTVKPAIVRISGQPRWETPAGGALFGAGLVALF